MGQKLSDSQESPTHQLTLHAAGPRDNGKEREIPNRAATVAPLYYFAYLGRRVEVVEGALVLRARQLT
jgi:hypothetical protein